MEGENSNTNQNKGLFENLGNNGTTFEAESDEFAGEDVTVNNFIIF
jgi:hypothetical protein